MSAVLRGMLAYVLLLYLLGVAASAIDHAVSRVGHAYELVEVEP